MTDKDIRKLEKAMEKVVREVLHIEEDNDINILAYDEETIIPASIIDDIEDYMGESITFMGIS